MALKPRELEQLQPGEFLQLWDGYIWRQEQNEDMLAYFVSCLMNVSGKVLKRRMTPKELLKPLREPKNPRDRKAEEEYLKERFGLKGGVDSGDSS
ncbi:MAG TPA: hypothetical protein DD789_04010 [Firmicutes bacterium]|nr:hypothetical protein [Bacillota bacterium]